MKKCRPFFAILITLILIFSACPVSLHTSALSAGANVKGKTVCQALGMNGSVYLNWLESHEHDHYYLGTPYRPYDHRNPNGDCRGAHGWLDEPGVSGMNCMGFVWHVLYMATKKSGGYVSRVEAMAEGRLTFYQGYNITRRYFRNKQEMLRSGYLEKGDIIWMIPDQDEYLPTVYHHVGIYWGDGHSDRLWHSNTVTGGQGERNVISKIYPMLDRDTLYVVLKVGAASLPAPKLKSVVNCGDRVTVSWKAVPRAAQYRVFVKESGKWKLIGQTKGTYFHYRKIADGKRYTFTVRCVSADGKRYTSSFDKKGITCLRLAAPKVTLKNTKDGVLLNWNKIKGATSYRVFLKTSQGYVKIGTTASTSFTYKKVQSGKKYTFTVRSLPENSKTGAYNKKGFKATYFSPPVITDIRAAENGVTLTWSKPAGAFEYYRVYKKQNGKWAFLADVTDRSYTDTTAVDDGEYTYAVCCLRADGKRETSARSETAVTVGTNEEAQQ